MGHYRLYKKEKKKETHQYLKRAIILALLITFPEILMLVLTICVGAGMRDFLHY